MAKKVSIIELEELKKSNDLVLGIFSVPWCGECKMMEEIIKLSEKKFPDIKFVTIDVDEQSIWSDDGNENYSILKVPTFIFYSKGIEVDRVMNFQSEINFTKFIKKNK